MRVFVNISCEDTALGAVRGQQDANLTRIFRRTLLVFATLTALTCLVSGYSAPTIAQSVNSSETDSPLVALASSFRAVWPILMNAYNEESNSAPASASFASSGLLSTQVLRGAPFDLFLSADQRSVTRLMAAGKTQTDPIALAIGTLSLVTLPSASGMMDRAPTFAWIRESIAKGSSMKIAIPNPRHAPYGIAAQQALTSAGLWPTPRSSLLNAENASQALQYVLSGAASIAIVPTTLVAQIPFDIKISTVDMSTYEPVVHHLAILTPAGENALQLSHWLTSPKALNIMMQFGLAAP